MAADFIELAKPRPQMGNELVSVANQLRDIRDRVDALNDAAGRQWDGADFAKLRNQFGVTVGTEANFLTLLGNLNTILNASGEVAGANRLSQLDEFISRLAGQ